LLNANGAPPADAAKQAGDDRTHLCIEKRCLVGVPLKALTSTETDSFGNIRRGCAGGLVGTVRSLASAT
jgi:hypothetical protein